MFVGLVSRQGPRAVTAEPGGGDQGLGELSSAFWTRSSAATCTVDIQLALLELTVVAGTSVVYLLAIQTVCLSPFTVGSQ